MSSFMKQGSVGFSSRQQVMTSKLSTEATKLAAVRFAGILEKDDVIDIYEVFKKHACTVWQTKQARFKPLEVAHLRRDANFINKQLDDL